MHPLSANFYTNSNLPQPPPLSDSSNYQNLPPLQGQQTAPLIDIQSFGFESYLSQPDTGHDNLQGFNPDDFVIDLNRRDRGRRASQQDALRNFPPDDYDPNTANRNGINANAGQQHDQAVNEIDHSQIELTDDEIAQSRSSQTGTNHELLKSDSTQADLSNTSFGDVDGSSNNDQLTPIHIQDIFNIGNPRTERPASPLPPVGGTVDDYGHGVGLQLTADVEREDVSQRQQVQPTSFGTTESTITQLNLERAQDTPQNSLSETAGTSQKRKHFAMQDSDGDDNADDGQDHKRRQTTSSFQALGPDATRKQDVNLHQIGRLPTNARQRKASATSRPSAQALYPAMNPSAARPEVVDCTMPTKAESASFLNITPTDLRLSSTTTSIPSPTSSTSEASSSVRLPGPQIRIGAR
jgi:hypothetical protein